MQDRILSTASYTTRSSVFIPPILGYSIFSFVYNYLQSYSPLPSYTTIFIQSARRSSRFQLIFAHQSDRFHVRYSYTKFTRALCIARRGKTPSKNHIERYYDFAIIIQEDSV